MVLISIRGPAFPYRSEFMVLIVQNFRLVLMCVLGMNSEKDVSGPVHTYSGGI